MSAKDTFITFYVKRVEDEKQTLESVPAAYREDVARIINEKNAVTEQPLTSETEPVVEVEQTIYEPTLIPQDTAYPYQPQQDQATQVDPFIVAAKQESESTGNPLF